MNKAQREIRRKKRVLEHAARIGNVRKACRYFGVARVRDHISGSSGTGEASVWLRCVGPGFAAPVKTHLEAAAASS